MMSFPIHRFVPRSIDLRYYVYRMGQDNFGLSDTLCTAIEEKCGVFSPTAVDRLGISGIDEVLESFVPDAFFIFSSSADEQHPLLKGVDPDIPLDVFLDSIPKDMRPPVFFTGIEQVCFDHGGLVVMSSYLSQIYTLHTRDGRQLLGACHDLEIGMDGQILSRSSHDPVWQYHVYDGVTFKLIEQQGMPMWDRDFPGLYYRDQIPQMLQDPTMYEDAYPSVKLMEGEDVAACLRDYENAWRVLVDRYRDDPELATEAVKVDKLAYTFLSEPLKTNLAFHHALLQQMEEPGSIYPYLSPYIRKDRQVVMMCYPECPEALEHLGVIDDRQILRNVFVKGRRHDVEKYLSLADDAIRGDRAFLLELAAHTYWVIYHTTPENYTDLAFVEQVVATYLEAEEARRSEWDTDLPF